MTEILDRLRSNGSTDDGAMPAVDSIVDITDPEIELLVPTDDVSHPEVSIVIPAVNEELTISDFVDWCMQGLTEAGIPGEVLIVDSSTDRTAQIALERGARVLKAPKRGLGRAYIDALPYIRGRVRRHGRRRLHIRLSPTEALCGPVAGRLRIRDGVSVARLHRTWFHAGTASAHRHSQSRLGC